MEKILFISHCDGESPLGRGSLEALTATRMLAGQISGSEFFIGLFGGKTKSSACQLGSAEARAIYSVSGKLFEQSRYSTDRLAILRLIEEVQPSLVIAAEGSRLHRILPGVAGIVGGRIETHIASITAENERILVNRWFYRQRMTATLSRKRRPWFLLLDQGAAKPFDGPVGHAELIELDYKQNNSCRTEVIGMKALAVDQQTIRPDAKLLFVAGAGWTKVQKDGVARIDSAEKLILGFLDKTKASLGGSKSMVELASENQKTMTFMTHLHQIGQTGATPRHPKGLSSCCHGEEPHVVGWRFINERRAINLDPNCGWAQGKADVLYVADAFALIEKINELLGDPT